MTLLYFPATFLLTTIDHRLFFIPKLKPMSFTPKYIAQAGIIAALYAVVTIVLAPISYGPVQIRVSEALTILPYLTPSAIPGLFLGCLLANIYGGLGIYDILGGSLLTLLAGIFTYLISRTKKPILAPLPPVLLNAFGVSLYLHFLFKLPYWLTVVYLGAGEIVACYLLGYPLLKIILSQKSWIDFFKA